jgi:hypothetical protein
LSLALGEYSCGNYSTFFEGILEYGMNSGIMIFNYGEGVFVFI